MKFKDAPALIEELSGRAATMIGGDGRPTQLIGRVFANAQLFSGPRLRRAVQDILLDFSTVEWTNGKLLDPDTRTRLTNRLMAAIGDAPRAE